MTKTQITYEDLVSQRNLMLEKEFVNVYYSEKLSTLASIWKDHPFSNENYIGLFDELVVFLTRNFAKYYYADIRKQHRVGPDARDHFTQVITPQTAAFGVGKSAIVLEGSIKKFYINFLITMTGRPAKFFTQQKKAFDYLYSEYDTLLNIKKYGTVSISELINERNLITRRPYVEAFYSSKYSFIAIIWKGIFDTEEYLQFYQEMLYFTEHNEVKGLLADITQQGNIIEDATNVLFKTMVPKAIINGLQKVAVVSGKSPFKAKYFDHILGAIRGEAKLFRDREDAFTYLVNTVR